MYAGTPQDASSYDVYEVDGVKVFVSPFIDMRRGLKIYLSGFSLFKGLAVAPIN